MLFTSILLKFKSHLLLQIALLMWHAAFAIEILALISHAYLAFLECDDEYWGGEFLTKVNNVSFSTRIPLHGAKFVSFFLELI